MPFTVIFVKGRFFHARLFETFTICKNEWANYLHQGFKLIHECVAYLSVQQRKRKDFIFMEFYVIRLLRISIN